ncbi:thaumatin [Schizophyllum amplum]|uniref:Thaumatin n=1 Tax=Schizophyllum amplum TaxID=97359 RepID=A0A550C9E4_9AGAR|nr:thaumatin [Auriculariopsis ampla]
MVALRIASALALAAAASARKMTVYNACPFTIWPAMYTPPDINSALPDHTTGWEAPAWSSVTFNVPDDWQSGRIWGRRNCDFSTNPGPNSCLTGGCNGGLVCDHYSGTGVPPATLAEWTMNGSGGLDNYDVSLVDGYNLPMRVSTNVGCPVAECPVDLGPNCPAANKGPFDSSGFPVGCKSDCQLASVPSNSPACCSGQWAGGPQDCPSSGAEPSYSYFKSNCPNAYGYAYDEPSGTALWTCPASKYAEYTVTFCP